MKIKRLVSFGLAACLTLAFSATALATTPQQNVNDSLNEININGLSAKFHVNSDELRKEIEKEANSPVFSPFSAIKADYGIKASTSSNVSNSIISPNTMIDLHYYNQNSTAYLATGYKTASGLWPAIGMCAVHHYSNGTPYIPFGKGIYYENHPVNIQGSIYNSFTVQDTGDPNFVQSSYWNDLFFGSNTSANRNAAINYGNQLVNYYYTTST